LRFKPGTPDSNSTRLLAILVQVKLTYPFLEYYVMKEYGGMDVNLYTFLALGLEGIGQLHSLATLPLGREIPVPIV
jgi:hypothetical protein